MIHSRTQLDQAPDVHAIVRSAVRAGLLDLTVTEFYENLRACEHPDDRQDYLQELWDRL